MANKSADATLSEAQTELVNVNARLSDASARRDKLLQFFADDKALDTIEAEITVLRRQHERQAARVKLFEKQVEQEQAEATLKRRKDHVERFQKKLADADKVADELQATIEKADALFRKVITLREDARVSWWGTSAHENALSVSPDGAALSGIAVKALLMHESCNTKTV
jgi:chromosome segregation ATPase